MKYISTRGGAEGGDRQEEEGEDGNYAGMHWGEVYVCYTILIV